MKLYTPKSKYGYVAVSDDKLQTGDWFLDEYKNICQFTDLSFIGVGHSDKFKKIIATDISFKIGNLAQFISDETMEIISDDNGPYFAKIYKKENTDNLYTEEQLKQAVNWAWNLGTNSEPINFQEDIINSLKKNKVLLSIEVEEFRDNSPYLNLALPNLYPNGLLLIKKYFYQ